MKAKIISASVYLVATVATAAYYDAVYGAGPMIHRAFSVRVGLLGMALLGSAFLFSLWKPLWAEITGALACCLCWFHFAPVVTHIPLFHIFSVIGYSYWAETFVAFLALILATVYSFQRGWAGVQNR